MIHPAIDKDYPAGVSAFRQLIAGARPSFHSWDIYKREGYDHLYFRGLVLRHSNGESGKYETYTYEATPALLEWARINGHRPTFRELIGRCGLNEVNEIRNLRRRLRNAATSVAYRGFPSKASVKHRVLVEAQGPDVTVNEDGEVSSKGLTRWYIQEFCRINGLRP